MANNIYVGGFPYKTTKEDLAGLFSSCGAVLSAKVILDRETGRPKGFGFVEMATDAEARAAVEKLNGAFMGDRKIFVVMGRPRKGPAPTRSVKPAPPPPPAAKPVFVERRSGKDRRGQGGATAGGRREGAPPPPFRRKPPVRGPQWRPKKD
ncbi:MAG: RNA-binding protein [Elusimicrobia bacterium]|nr:RNA-binding protein [Elusimicrobiota bacterium]